MAQHVARIEGNLTVRSTPVGVSIPPAFIPRPEPLMAELHQGSIVVDADLSTLGPNLTILGGMEKGEALVGADYRDRPDFWRLS